MLLMTNILLPCLLNPTAQKITPFILPAALTIQTVLLHCSHAIVLLFYSISGICRTPFKNKIAIESTELTMYAVHSFVIFLPLIASYLQKSLIASPINIKSPLVHPSPHD